MRTPAGFPTTREHTGQDHINGPRPISPGRSDGSTGASARTLVASQGYCSSSCDERAPRLEHHTHGSRFHVGRRGKRPAATGALGLHPTPSWTRMTCATACPPCRARLEISRRSREMGPLGLGCDAIRRTHPTISVVLSGGVVELLLSSCVRALAPRSTPRERTRPPAL